MDKSLKTMLLILTGCMMLLSIIATTKFRALRLQAIESPEEEARLRRSMRFLIILMTMVMMCLVIISRYGLIRYFFV